MEQQQQDVYKNVNVTLLATGINMLLEALETKPAITNVAKNIINSALNEKQDAEEDNK